MKNRFNSGLSSTGTSGSSNGASAHETYLEFGGISEAKNLLLFLIYYDQVFSPQLTTKERNQQIKKRFQAGEAISVLARAFGISPQRVDQIVKPNKRSEK